jgi:hypothetical protein
MNREVKYQLFDLYRQLEEAEQVLMWSDNAADRYAAGIEYDKIQAAIQDLKESVYT